MSRNFNDVFNDFKNGVSIRSPRNAADEPKDPPKWLIGKDILSYAEARNNILTEQTYKENGWYTIEQVNKAYGSFNAACMELNIINPDNIDDYGRIVDDIRMVASMHANHISAEIYKDEGIFSFEAIDKKYGFNNILMREGYKEFVGSYKTYPVKRKSRIPYFAWVYTRNRKIFSVESRRKR